jgi:hypothetical protein
LRRTQGPACARRLLKLRQPIRDPKANGDGFPRRPAAQGKHFLDGWLIHRGDYSAGARHTANEVVELPLDGREIRINIGVIKLEIVDQQRARVVVHKLGALVEERRVVLIRLDNKKVTLGPGAQTRQS